MKDATVARSGDSSADYSLTGEPVYGLASSERGRATGSSSSRHALSSAERAECTCPEACERDHANE